MTGKELADKGSTLKKQRTIIFKVIYLGQCGCGMKNEVSRKIEVKEESTIEKLHEAIIYEAFGWDDPHLYEFCLDNIPYSKNTKKAYGPAGDDCIFEGRKPQSAKTKLRDLGLKKGQNILFVFDFGDDHHFRLNVEDFSEAKAGVKYPRIFDEIGEAPEQYEDESDEDTDEDECNEDRDSKPDSGRKFWEGDVSERNRFIDDDWRKKSFEERCFNLEDFDEDGNELAEMVFELAFRPELITKEELSSMSKMDIAEECYRAGIMAAIGTFAVSAGPRVMISVRQTFVEDALCASLERSGASKDNIQKFLNFLSRKSDCKEVDVLIRKALKEMGYEDLDLNKNDKTFKELLKDQKNMYVVIKTIAFGGDAKKFRDWKSKACRPEEN